MAYVLEEITAEDIEKIINDAPSNPRRQGHLLTAKKYSAFPDTWAIDRERNCYLLWKPMQRREESFDRPYYIFALGRTYQIRTEGGVTLFTSMARTCRPRSYFPKYRTRSGPPLRCMAAMEVGQTTLGSQFTSDRKAVLPGARRLADSVRLGDPAAHRYGEEHHRSGECAQDRHGECGVHVQG